ncbi:MAG: hypothetical protein O2931_12380, partial [Planctomycetota bacterium]|nr:hypothetical protein [Planctomycetota bacterium]
NDGTTGDELWKTDGTDNGTMQIKDILPGDNSSSPWSLTNVDGTLYFVANDGTTGHGAMEDRWNRKRNRASQGHSAGIRLVSSQVPHQRKWHSLFHGQRWHNRL